MANVEAPSPGLFASVLHALRSADPRERTVPMVFGDLISALTEAEAAQLPFAIGGVLPLLRADPDRLRLAADVLVRFDMYEGVGALLEMALATGDRDLLLSAASLAGNPGTSSDSVHRLSELVVADPVARIRLDPGFGAATAELELLRDQRWPGFRSDTGPFRLAPVAVLDQDLGASVVLKLAVSLVDAGVVVRQLGRTSDIPQWFGPQTVAICRPPLRSHILSARPDLPERQIFSDPKLDSEQAVSQLLRRVNAVLPREQPLRVGTRERELPTSIWHPDVFALGVYETREAAFLTSAPSTSLYTLANKGLLTPRDVGVKVWTFRDLVAVRTWRYLKARSGKRVRSDVVPALAEFAGDPEASRVGAASDGSVLVDRGDGWVNIRSGEQLLDIEIADLDDVFQPFSIGGRSAPDLLFASENTRLHPAVLHGAPHLKDHRVSARALAQLFDRGGEDAIVGAYPELAAVPFGDTVQVGRQMIAAR